MGIPERITSIVFGLSVRPVEISGVPVRISARWDHVPRGTVYGEIWAHFDGKSGRPMSRRMGSCSGIPERVLLEVLPDPVVQRIAAAMIAQGLARYQ